MTDSDSDTDRRPDDIENRLFVPLKTEHYRNFERGAKTWELRGAKGIFHPDRVTVNQPVELRRGYSTNDSLWGEIAETKTFDSIDEIPDEIDHTDILPDSTRKEFIESATAILESYDEYIAIAIDLNEIDQGGKFQNVTIYSDSSEIAETVMSYDKGDNVEIKLGNGSEYTGHISSIDTAMDGLSQSVKKVIKIGLSGGSGTIKVATEFDGHTEQSSLLHAVHYPEDGDDGTYIEITSIIESPQQTLSEIGPTETP